MNYTKGEWTIQEFPHKHDLRKGCAYVIRDKRNCALAEVGHIDAIFDGEETSANAHLIAAAPEMYEAIKQLFKDAGLDFERVFPETYTRMSKALAKAEGVK